MAESWLSVRSGGSDARGVREGRGEGEPPPTEATMEERSDAAAPGGAAAALVAAARAELSWVSARR
eukprot:292403-Prymnesium_polylepis.1